MREILFRGKDIKGNWHIGLLAHQSNAWIISNKAGVATAYEVIPETVGQYTGLTDKNGKKIFEGDILKGAFRTDIVVYYDNDYLQFRAKRIIDKILSHEIDYYGLARIKVIGNIHDNSDLLKGGTEE